MSKSPITIYVPFQTAAAIKVRAEAQGVSQSHWLCECAKLALTQDNSMTPDTLKGGHFYLEALADVWIDMQPNPAAIHERISALMKARSAKATAAFERRIGR